VNVRNFGLVPALLNDRVTNMRPDSARVRVVIYSRPGCHLCDEAKQAIQAAGCQNEYTLTEIDIESDPDLLRRYQYDIPVITIDGIEAFRHSLTSEEFRLAITHC
jgi:glutaredoxin